MFLPNSFVLKRNFSSSTFGFFFDIDGVFLKGKNVIPAAKNAFRLLIDRKDRWRVPAVFVTNAGNKLRKDKAADLSDRFKVYISPDQVVMSHSPLRMFTQFHNKNVLVCGQGPVKEVATMLGFKYVLTVDDLRDQYPQLDVCDHNRRIAAPCGFEQYNKPVEAIILFGEPSRWESSLQLLLDILMTNGQPYRMISGIHRVCSDKGVEANYPYPHIPLLACNMDMQWMAEAPLPRLGHGCFLLTLEALYEKLSGRKLLYTALIGKPSELTYHYAEYRLNKVAQDMLGIRVPIKQIYCIGDNPQTDIYGANLYNKYLEAHQGSGISDEIVRSSRMIASTNFNESQYIACNSIDFLTRQDLSGTEMSQTRNDIHTQYLKTVNNDRIIKAGFAESCKSILVLTGVTMKDHSLDMKSMIEVMTRSNVNHNHRDFPDYWGLKVPSHVCLDVDEAVSYVYKRENFFSN